MSPAPDKAAALRTLPDNSPLCRDFRFSSPALPTLFLIALGAAGLFFGQPNTLAHLPPLALLFPFCLYILALRAASDKNALLRGWLLGLAGNCAGLYWMVFPMHDVAGMPLVAAAVCVALLSAYLGCFTALAGLGMRRLRRLPAGPEASGGNSPGRTSFLLPVLAPLLSGLVYAGFEVLCGTLFTGFPWLSLSSAFAFWPAWAQTASLTGSYGLSALYAGAACLAAWAVLAHTARERLCAAFLAVCLCAAQPVYGWLRLSSPLPAQAGPELSLVMVQGNIDQNQKWLPEFQRQTLDHYITLSRKALDSARPSSPPALVLWPETAMPFYFQLHRDYAAELHRFASDNNVNLMFGTLGMEARQAGDNTLHNRIYLISPTGLVAGWYDKKHLVPFGEYIPFAADIPFLSNLLQGVDFTPGRHDDALWLQLPGKKHGRLEDAPSPSKDARTQGLSLGTLICYEAIFPYLAQEQVDKGASIFVNVSNDAWFRQSSAPWQHLSLTAMRAVEQARPIVRCTNTGISAIIDSRGRIVSRGEKLFVADSFAAIVAPSDELTLYHRLHPLPQGVLAVGALLSLLLPRPRGRGMPARAR